MTQSASPIHVIHIASGDLWAGAEVQLYTLCKCLKNMNDVTVSVILLNHGALERKLQEYGVHVEVLDESKLNSFQILIKLIKRLQNLNPGLIHTHRTKENILGSLAARIAGDIPSLRTVHGAPEHQPSLRTPHKYLLYLLDWFAARFLQAKIIAVSQDLKTLLEKDYPANKIQVIENGVDIDALASYRAPQIPKDSNKHKSFKVGLVGRLVPVKRVDIFIKTAKYIQDHHPEHAIRFHIYGDGPLFNKLKTLSNSLDVNDVVEFEGHRDDIHREIASLDALLITSDHEGLPMTLLEAMALGTPIVAHSVGGITEACQRGKSCWLTTNNNLYNISKALLNCLNEDPESKITRINLALSRIEHYYSAESNAQQLKNAYLAATRKPDH